MVRKEKLLGFLKESIAGMEFQFKVAALCNVNTETSELHAELIDHLEKIKKLIEEEEFNVAYLQQFEQDAHQAISSFSYSNNYKNNEPNNDFIRRVGGSAALKEIIENQSKNAYRYLEKIRFNLKFFKKLGLFEGNIVAIGANGSGKSSLAELLKTYIRQNGVIISAQRLMRIPSLNSIHNPKETASDLQRYQLEDKSNKSNNSLQYINQEYEILIKNLIAEHNWANNEFKKTAIEASKNKVVIPEPLQTRLEKTIEIWNGLIEHRELDCKDGMNIHAIDRNGQGYDAFKMSDGEKVILFLIAQILQAPSNGFIVIDEPEMYLHKTILKKLWDRLEKEREDCIFLYLTHDLEFATSRTTAKKVWIKSFTPPQDWEIDDLPENELPEALTMELVGSRKDILFCEGEKGSLDEKVYNTLFPEYTITPVKSCFNVIYYTKAYNATPNLNTKAFGLVDSDYHSNDRLEELKKENIFSLNVSEIENLFFDEDFLQFFGTKLLVDELAKTIDGIKREVLNLLLKEKEMQVAKYISAKIDYYFKDSNVSKGKTLIEVETKFSEFTDEIDIVKWFKVRTEYIERTIKNDDYKKVISLFNNKGLKKIGNQYLKISDFENRAIRILQTDEATHEILKKYFPDELTRASEIKTATAPS